jgi:hypothetical protein
MIKPLLGRLQMFKVEPNLTMKWVLYKIPTALILVCLLTSPITINGAENIPSNEPILYSVEAVREDFSFLYETLQISSYDLFLNTTRTDYDNAFEQVMNSITDPMTYLEINRLFQPFVVLAGFSHCALDFPSEVYQRFYQQREQTVQSPSFMKSGRTFEFIGDVAYLRPGIFLNAESHDISTREAFSNDPFTQEDEILDAALQSRHQFLMLPQ